VATAAADSTAGLTANRIEALLSARLFVEPQLVGDRLYFVSNLSGHLSLYSMDAGGGVPEPLLPPQMALQNPELVGGHLFHVLPRLGRIVFMLDSNGDENYVPYLVPLEGGFPEPLAAETFRGSRSHLTDVDDATETAYFAVESREESLITAIRVDLAAGDVETLFQSPYGAFVSAWTPDHSRVIHVDGYTMGDVVLYESDGHGGRRMLYGTPIEERDPGTEPELTGFRSSHGTASGKGVLLTTTLFDDTGSFGYLDLEQPGVVEPVAISGVVHEGVGELEAIQHLEGDRFALVYNIDGCSWVYDARRPHRRCDPGAGRAGRSGRRCPARPSLREGKRALRRLVLHGDDAHSALRSRSGRHFETRKTDERARARTCTAAALIRRGRLLRVPRRP